MTEIERIQNDLDKGYTVAKYGNTKALHEQMLKDIKYLNDLAKNNESLHDVIKSYSEKNMDDAYDKGYNDGASAAANDIMNSL